MSMLLAVPSWLAYVVVFVEHAMRDASKGRKAAMVFILITMFLDVLGIGIIIPVLPQLVTDLLDGDKSQAASYYGMIAASFAAMQFLFAPLLGRLSDRYGRRPVLLFSLFGFGINYIILGLAPTLTWLFVARILSGITGASFTTVNAYIADVSSPEQRAQNYGMVGAVFGLGFIAGPALGGVLGHIGPRMPFFASAVIVLLNVIYGYFVLPESLPVDKRQAVQWRKANPLSGILGLGRYPIVAGLAVCFMFASLAQRGMETVWVLYTSYRFGWEQLQNGLALALVGIMAAFVQGFLIRKIIPRLGERRTVLTGLGFAIVGYVFYGFASEGWMMLATVAIGSMAGLATPAIQGLVAGSVPASEQGGIQGSLTALMSLTAIIAPLLMGHLFSAFSGDRAIFELPGAPFFLGAVLFVAAFGVAVVVFRHNPAPSASVQ